MTHQDNNGQVSLEPMVVDDDGGNHNSCDQVPNSHEENVHTSSPPPPPSKQKEMITKELLQQPLKIGDYWYVVSQQWMDQWKQRVGFEDDAATPPERSDIASPLGQIDNSALLVSGNTHSENPKLLKHVQEYVDYQLVPEEVWQLLHKW